jgi:outer membrane immunogenic protein
MKFVVVAALAVLGLAVLSNGATAQSTDVVLHRLDVLEKKNDTLEKENAALRDRVRRLEAKKTAALPAAPAAALPSTATYAMVTKAPVAPAPDWRPVSPFNWTGIYVGAHSGYALGSIRAPAADFNFLPTDFNGWFGGAQVGANYQLSNNWVIGAVADFSLADINTRQDRFDGVDFFRVEQLGTLRGRLGYAMDRTLLYATGGLAWGRMRVTDREFGTAILAVNPVGMEKSDTQTYLGYAVGGGVETALLDNFTFNAEYLYVNLPPQPYIFAFLPSASQTSGTSVGWQGHTLKFGVNYLFH